VCGFSSATGGGGKPERRRRRGGDHGALNGAPGKRTKRVTNDFNKGTPGKEVRDAIEGGFVAP